jgi:hypothetical protein
VERALEKIMYLTVVEPEHADVPDWAAVVESVTGRNSFA